jgi:hypothetical protein
MEVLKIIHRVKKIVQKRFSHLQSKNQNVNNRYCGCLLVEFHSVDELLVFLLC